MRPLPARQRIAAHQGDVRRLHGDDWTYCRPYAFVRDYVATHGDNGEIEAFRKSWCWYDWTFTYAMVGGSYETHGYYQRTHTLSAGDAVCDMCWYGGRLQTMPGPEQAGRA